MNLLTLWDTISAIREQCPLVHNITNFVTMNNSANALLACGASPAMVHSPDEVAEFVQLAKSLVVNIGTLYEDQITGMKLAAQTANKSGIPWVLDPVGVGATSLRKRVVKELLQLKPTLIRGNASEILSIANDNLSGGRGVDSIHSSESAVSIAKDLANQQNCVVATTGATDFITDGTEIMSIHNGHPLMSKVTALGCSLSAILGACLAVNRNALESATAGIAFFGLAGEIAAERSRGPGSMQVEILNALYELTSKDFCGRIKVQNLPKQ